MILRIGKVLRAKGLKGELVGQFLFSRIMPGVGDDLFFEKSVIFSVEKSTNIKNFFGPYKVEKIKFYKWSKNSFKKYIIKLKDVNDLNTTTLLTNTFIGKEIDLLPKNVFLVSELKKCELYDDKNNFIGKVVDVVENKNYYALLVVKKNNSEEIFIPFVKDVIEKIDLVHKKISLKNVDGILEQ